MVACLVQQLFRQRIGKGLDPSLIDEVFFPILRSRKDLPREILLDIKLTRSCNDDGQSSIIHTHRHTPTRNILPFTKRRSGKNSSKRRRRSQKLSAWGSIDIVNQLRDLKHPQIRYHNPCDPQDYPNTEFVLGHIFIRLDEEDQKKLRKRRSATRIQRQGHRRVEIHQQQVDLKFVNDYLEDCLTTGKRLSWGRDPGHHVGDVKMILSTYY
jgi:hypothetical protein